jgi:hypothetical protein
VPYLDTLRWVSIAVALVGIAVTIYARLDDWKQGVIGALLTGIAASPWMRAVLCYGAIALTVQLLFLALRRFGERTGRLAEQLETLEKINDVRRRMLEAAARCPRDRHELAGRLRDARF